MSDFKSDPSVDSYDIDSGDSSWYDKGDSARTLFSQDDVKAQSLRYRGTSNENDIQTVESANLPPVTSKFLFQPTNEEDSDMSFITPKQWLCCKCNKKIHFPSKVTDPPSTCISEGVYDFCNELCWKSSIESSVRRCPPHVNNVPLLQSNVAPLTQNKTDLPLEIFTSLQSLRYMLRCVFNTRNGCLITKIILFIKSRCDKHNFKSLLIENPIALDHYSAFLLETGQINKAHSLLLKLGRSSDAQMFKYKDMRAEFPQTQADTIRQRLVSFTNEYLSNTVDLAFESELVHEHIQLLDLQKKMKERGDLKKLRETVDASTPESLHTFSLVDTVYYYALLHGYQGALDAFVNQFKIQNSVSFAWMCARAYAAQDDWGGLYSAVTLKKSILRPRMQSTIPPKRLLFFLVTYGVEDQIFEKFLLLISDLDELCDTAIQLRKGKSAVMECVFQRNKKQLEALLGKLERDDQDFARSYLAKPVALWPSRKGS